MSFFMIRIMWRYKDEDMKSNHPDLWSVLTALQLYPLVMFITWGPNLLFSMVVSFGYIAPNTGVIDTFNAVSILATQGGTALAIVFFIKSKEAGYRWMHLFGLQNVFGQGQGIGDGRDDNGTPTFPTDFPEEVKFTASGFHVDGSVERDSSDDYTPFYEEDTSLHAFGRTNTTHSEVSDGDRKSAGGGWSHF